ncbi:hypothetical protein MRO49_25325, partial [Escherichia coli]|nr:hypothetical protein [Escherichia coli]
ALVFGSSGQIGVPVLARLRARGWRVQALSRQARADGEGVRWLQGDFAQLPELPARVDAIFSLGPLDRFAQWFETAEIETPRVVAFG